MSEVKLPIPLKFRRGSLRENEAKSLDSAIKLLDWVSKEKSIQGARILDFGCGVKISQALFQLDSPQQLYFGLDVYEEMVQYLKDALSDYPNYAFESVNFWNEMYNQDGEVMTRDSILPVGDGKFDILMMFSVITHMNPKDSDAVLGILRRYAARDSKLFFWAFADEAQSEDFIDYDPRRPLLRAKYRRSFLESIIADTGWKIERAVEIVRNHKKVRYVCSVA